MKRFFSLTLTAALLLCFGVTAFAQVSRVGAASADLPAGTALTAVCVANTLSAPDAQRIIGGRGQVLGILYQQNLTIQKADTHDLVYMQAKIYFNLDPVVVNTHKVGLIYKGKYLGYADYNSDSGVATHIFDNLNGDVVLVLMDPVAGKTSAAAQPKAAASTTTAAKKSPKTGDNEDALALAMLLTIGLGAVVLTRKATD